MLPWRGLFGQASSRARAALRRVHPLASALFNPQQSTVPRHHHPQLSCTLTIGFRGFYPMFASMRPVSANGQGACIQVSFPGHLSLCRARHNEAARLPHSIPSLVLRFKRPSHLSAHATASRRLEPRSMVSHGTLCATAVCAALLRRRNKGGARRMSSGT
jgi:hypothetical protein